MDPRQKPEIPPPRAIVCPPGVRFRRILKDTYTNGRIYGAYERRDTVWLGQSLYSMVPEINKHRETRLHVSTAYRVLRGEAAYLQGMTVERLRDVEHVNELLDRVDALCVVVVTRCPDKWELAAFRKAKLE